MLRTARRGYDRRAVDEFLLRCADSLGDRVDAIPELIGLRGQGQGLPPLDAGDVQAVQFAVVLRGYDVAQVDDVLARVAAALPGQDDRPRWEGDPPAATPAVDAGVLLRKVVRGYDVEQVDAFLVRCAHSLGRRVEAVPELAPLLGRPRTGTPLRPRDVEVAQFHVRGWGYDIEQVDTLLDRVADALLGRADSAS